MYRIESEKKRMRLIDADKLLKCKTHAYVNLVSDRCEEVIKVKNVECANTVNAILIPKNATNGDMIKAMFPNATIDSTFDNEELNEELGLIIIKGMDNGNVPFYKTWWNAPYKTENKN